LALALATRLRGRQWLEGVDKHETKRSLARRTPVHLANDYIHPTPRAGRCRIRIYIPEEEIDAPVVICSELCSNEGASVTYVAEQLAAEVIRYNHLRTPLVWIEHYPPETTNNRTEIFNLVSFSSYEVTERGPYLGEVRFLRASTPPSYPRFIHWLTAPSVTPKARAISL
jgi:hypothetical protein